MGPIFSVFKPRYARKEKKNEGSEQKKKKGSKEESAEKGMTFGIPPWGKLFFHFGSLLPPLSLSLLLSVFDMDVTRFIYFVLLSSMSFFPV